MFRKILEKLLLENVQQEIEITIGIMRTRCSVSRPKIVERRFGNLFLSNFLRTTSKDGGKRKIIDCPLHMASKVCLRNEIFDQKATSPVSQHVERKVISR